MVFVSDNIIFVTIFANQLTQNDIILGISPSINLWKQNPDQKFTLFFFVNDSRRWDITDVPKNLRKLKITTRYSGFLTGFCFP